MLLLAAGSWPSSTVAQSRYATSDSLKGFVHWIDLYDDQNQRIDPSANHRPYSPEKTCGRCHDYKTIAHGWHFNGPLDKASDPGRPGQPLVWSDARSGTHLPLSYRGWPGTHHPQQLGLTHWQMAAKLGGYLPGLTVDASHSSGSYAALADTAAQHAIDRSRITGALPIDCMLCHHRPSSGYSPFVWTEQIAEQNFAYAPTAALGLAVVTGGMRRLKEDFDPTSEETRDQLPKVQYDTARFRSDGKVFIDVLRKPSNDACYYCHSNIATDSLSGARWLHDEDVHLRAGVACADCHRNGLDHQTVRGFDGEQHAAGELVGTLSCTGCHMPDPAATQVPPSPATIEMAGRLGAPKPAHYGLPPIHFEKLSCTACHAGPALSQPVPRQLNSIVHQLGSHVKRTGLEQPAILGSVMLPVDASGQLTSAETNGRYTPHRLLWPSYWAVLKDGQLTPLNPEQAYDLVRKSLKVRKDLAEEIGEIKLSLAKRQEILGDERAARLKPEELNDQQRAALAAAESEERRLQVEQRMLAALSDIESAIEGAQAVYISGGVGLTRDPDGRLSNLSADKLGMAAQPYAWPVAHAVRPARQSLGASGCTQCHSDDSKFFFAEVTPVGTLPDQVTEPLKVHRLQQVDVQRLRNWNQLFAGRDLFKIVGLLSLALTLAVAVSAAASSLSSRRAERP
ncbi:MAG: hypothetical protein KF752_10110 [Pirellulaceae bacterium]|nr:hypothetical protein [Pirellulaceae bacterium]